MSLYKMVGVLASCLFFISSAYAMSHEDGETSNGEMKETETVMVGEQTTLAPNVQVNANKICADLYNKSATWMSIEEEDAGPSGAKWMFKCLNTSDKGTPATGETSNKIHAICGTAYVSENPENSIFMVGECEKYTMGNVYRFSSMEEMIKGAKERLKTAK